MRPVTKNTFFQKEKNSSNYDTQQISNVLYAFLDQKILFIKTKKHTLKDKWS